MKLLRNSITHIAIVYKGILSLFSRLHDQPSRMDNKNPLQENV